MKRKSHDYVFLVLVLILLAIGIVMVFSSSYYYALSKWHDKYHFLKKELVWSGIGLLIMFVTMNINYKIYKYLSWILLIASTGLLIATLSFGDIYNGAQRWLTIYGFQFMSSEVSKISLIIFFAHMLSSKKYSIKKFWDIFKPYLIIIGITSALILKQPDYSTLSVIVAVLLTMMFISGAKFRYFLPVIALGGVFAWRLIIETPYRLQRILTFLKPFDDPMGSGWQIINSLYAFGMGGLIGVGIGQSTQNKLYIPEPQNDFILATFGEEFGFVGTLILISLFIALIYRGINIAKKAEDQFGSLLAFGIIFLVAVQTIINIGVCTALLPVTGMTLPFISFGGTNLIILMGSMGIVLNISKHTEG